MTQLEIAKRILDVQFLENGTDYHATGFEIEEFLNDLKFEINGVIYQLNVNEYADLQIYEKIILNELKRNKPILTSYNKLSSSIADYSYGHVVVISGVNYSVSGDVKTIKELIVIDPENKTDSLLITYREKELEYFLLTINSLWSIDLIYPTYEEVLEQQKRNNPEAFRKS